MTSTSTPHYVEVQAPATTANLGPGFDCMGMALNIYDRFSLSLEPGAPPTDALEQQQTQLVLIAAERLYQVLGQPTPTLTARCSRDIPLGRGLGSSAAAIVAGLLGANTLAGSPLSLEEVGHLAAEVEGHPDNSSPCLYGGFQLCVMDEANLVHVSVPVPENLKAVLFIPDFAMPTHETRKLIPSELSRSDVVFQSSRAALIVAALSSGQVAHLATATQDRLHQPARGTVFPAMWKLFEAARTHGAHAAYLSGGGPTVLALTTEREEEVLRALETAAHAAGIGGEGRVALPTAQGAAVLSSR